MSIIIEWPATVERNSGAQQWSDELPRALAPRYLRQQQQQQAVFTTREPITNEELSTSRVGRGLAVGNSRLPGGWIDRLTAD